MDIKGELAGFLRDPFNKKLAIALLVLGAVMLVLDYSSAPAGDYSGKVVMHFFFSPTCQHCAAQEPFNEKLESEFPDLVIVKHDITIPSESRQMLIMAQQHGIGPESLGTPTSFIGPYAFIGFESEELTGGRIRESVEDCLDGCSDMQGGAPVTSESLTRGLDLPILGKTDLSGVSLPLLAVILGTVDGFNPCAMWVLVYLISLLMNLNDKKRLALVAGTFVFASGVLYFLFMTAWLNAFIFLGYVRAVTIIVGLIALGGGILSIREFLETGGAMVCKVTGAEEKKKLAQQMKDIVSAPLSWITFAGIVFLAFTINSVEFLCSAAIPAVFTQVLALSDLPSWQYYAYIALYDFFFMLDDLLIFGSALLVVSNAGDKYARYCKMVGGAIMLLLGVLLLFAPQMLS